MVMRAAFFSSRLQVFGSLLNPSYSSETTTITLYSPGNAPSSVRKVVNWKLPSASDCPLATLADRLSSTGIKETVAPGNGLPSRVTIPSTLTVLAPPQPAAVKITAERTEPTRAERLRILILVSYQSFHRRKA